MIDLFAVSVGAAGSLMAYLVYDRLAGCRGGHVWGEWEDEHRWRITPFTLPYRVGIERRQVRGCQRDNCNATDTTWTNPRKVSSEDVEEALEDL